MPIIKNYGLYNPTHEEKYSHNTPDEEEIRVCIEWLNKRAKNKKVNKNDCIYSYSLKHLIERRMDTYVSNGACIEAAIRLGYEYWSVPNSINASFFMELLLPEDDWKRVKPSGFTKWLFKHNFQDPLIQDLANDAEFDENWPRNGTNFYSFYFYLNSVTYDYDVIECLYEAWSRYSDQVPLSIEEIDEIIDKTENFYEKYRWDRATDDRDQYCLPWDTKYRVGDVIPIAQEGLSYVYCLYEYVTNSNGTENIAVRYIGQTTNPSKRLQDHIFSPGRKDKMLWASGFLNRNDLPKMGILTISDKLKANQFEQAYIHSFHQIEEHYVSQGHANRGLFNQVHLNA